MVITIHQPNFVPWYPFFEKMQQADVFVLLGNCQFEKNGYQNRFYLKDKWNTLSTKKGLVSIKEKSYINITQDWEKIKKHLNEYETLLSEMDYCLDSNLYTTNVNIIRHLAEKLKISTPILEDYPTSLTSTERLVDICKHYNATTYLAGQGGKAYLNEELFKKEGIKVMYQDTFTNIHTLEYLKNEIAKF